MTKEKAIAKARKQAQDTEETRYVVLDPDPERDETEKNGYHVVNIMDMATTYANIDPKDVVWCSDDELL
jgi:hypothetical protein